MACENNAAFLSVREAAGFDDTASVSIKHDLFDGTYPVGNFYPQHASLRYKLIHFSQDHPVVLMPLRLETRYKNDQLCIRIYPDQIAINDHEPRLSETEAVAGFEYHTVLVEAENLNEAESAAAKQNAWRGLAALLGPTRAAWVVKETKDKEMSELKLKLQDRLTVPTTMALPDRFAAFLYRGNNLWKGSITGKRIRRSLAMIGTPSATQKELFDNSSRWVVDYNKAELEGMAISVDLSELTELQRREGFSRIVVVGIRSSTAVGGQCTMEQLIENHHYTKGFAFLKNGTPTNNTEQVQSGHSQTGEDREKSYEIEVLDPPGWDSLNLPIKVNAQRLGQALGFGLDADMLSILKNIEHSTDQEDAYAADIQHVIWPATGDFMLRHLLPDKLSDTQLGLIKNHFHSFVQASGPLAAIRAGNQPYSILPVTSVTRREDDPNGWQASVKDNGYREDYKEFENKLQQILVGLSKVWLTWAKDYRRVPRVNTTNDPDLELLQLLSMEPVSQSYRLRPFLCDRFTGWLLALFRYSIFGAFGHTPHYWIGRWGYTWNEYRNNENGFWRAISGVTNLELRSSPLLHMFGWAHSRKLPIPLVYGDTGGDYDDPVDYLESLCNLESGKTNTLLFELIRRTRIIHSPVGNTPGIAIQQSICRLAVAARDEKIDIDRLFRETLDLHTHRLDAWITAHATKRLKAMRTETPNGLYIGAYGWVDGLKPRDSTTDSCGFIHTPSRGQAAAAAVLHNAYLTHNYNDAQPNPFSINLNSERVRRGLRLLEGIRQGQTLGALLGYQFERELHEHRLDRFIDDFRRAFPLVVSKETETNEGESADDLGARNVVDGLQLLRWWQDREHYTGTSNVRDIGVIDSYLARVDEPFVTLKKEVERLVEALDCVNDLLTYEGVYQTVQGNYERGGAALDAASGNAHPPEIESVKTPVSGKLFGHRVCMLFPPEPADTTAEDDHRGRAEPRIAAWLAGLWSDLAEIACHYHYQNDSLRININEADVNALTVLPGISSTDSQLVFDYRDQNGSFETLDDLDNIDSLNSVALQALKRWVMTGKEINNAQQYYEHININTADVTELLLLGIDAAQADAIIVYRTDISLIRRLAELKVILADDTFNVDAIRRFATTGINNLSVAELQLSHSDLLYLSTSPPQGEETEIEQRIRYFVRHEYALRHDTVVEIDMLAPEDFDFGLGEALELGRQLLAMLQAGNVLQPDSLRLPAEADNTQFTDDDVTNFLTRVNTAYTSLTIIAENLVALIDEANETLTDKVAALDILFEAARFGVLGAIPPGPDDPLLYIHVKNTYNELIKRGTEFVKIRDTIDTTQTTVGKIEKLIEGIKILFSGGFVSLPTFSLKGGEETDRVAWAAELDQAFAQTNLLAGQDDERIHLWLRQAAQVHPSLQDLENGLIMTEAWSQSTLESVMPALGLGVAQLPYNNSKHWYALDDDERGSGINDTDNEGRGYLSLVTVFAKGESVLPFSGDTPKLAAGLLLDQWDELIPSDTINTSVAFQYNAPNTQAPQSLLLAVPSQRDDPDKEWSLEELASIVSDTLDLAKIRSVDLDAMRKMGTASAAERGVGHMFPGIMLPVDPENWQWGRNGDRIPNIGDWERYFSD